MGSLVLVYSVMLKPWLVIRKMRFPSLSTICQSLPRWLLWPRHAAICSNSSKATRQRPLVAFSSAYLGNKLRLIAKTLKSKRDTKLGLSELWRRVNEQLVSLTNPESLKSPPRKRRVNFGKKKSFIMKKSPKKVLPQNVFSISILKKKSQHIGFVCCLAIQLSVQQKPPLQLIYNTVYVFRHFNSVFTISCFTTHYKFPIYYYPKKYNVLTKTKTITNKGTA